MKKVELRFVPLWVQRALAASSMPISDALDESKISRILSTVDIDFYTRSQLILKSPFFFKMVCGSFENFSGDKTPEVVYEISNEELADYVYGHIPMGDVRNSTPAYTSSVCGLTDTIIVSVVTGPEAEQFCKHMFMERLIEQLVGLRSLEHVAPLPIFNEWVKKVE